MTALTSDAAHLAGYEIPAALFAFGAIWVGAVRLRRGGDGAQWLLFWSLVLGFVFYQSAALIFVPALAEPFGIRHAFGLLTQMAGLAWNVSTVLLVLSWRYGAVPGTRARQLGALFVAGEVIFVVTFAWMYPGPEGANYIVNVAGQAVGTVYLLTYAVSMLFTKAMVVAICLPQLRHVAARTTRVGIAAVIVGSILIGGFGLARLLSGIQPLIGVDSERWESVALLLHVLGAVVYVAGIVFVEIASGAVLLASGMWSLLRLRPLCAAVVEQFPHLGAPPRPGAGELLSAERIGAHVVRRVVLLSDAALLLGRGPGGDDGSIGAATDFDDDAHAAYRAELRRMLTAARAYGRTRRGDSRSEALRRCLTPNPPRAAALPEP
ncbi:hypothetical protein [Nocardia pseudobrasiliensis]|uniref:Integral membrane protein n=1 Tax=Nocardia pseudobrasiliensis TaxID=45979 RepID=A0A370HWH9_9NOCA|nr:hypothetical protein [Nocardia pseudobrasiliensis]RDI62866.1 hypothetical protein DFR76_112184 [Nocardia pseudobrasiliensis]